MFIDYVEIEVLAGNGGHGCISFHTEKYMPKGGPDGGEGGRGGDIIAVANPQLTTLLDFRYKKKYRAPNGNPGSGNNRSGRSGEDVILQLPVGTIIRECDSGQIIADLDKPGLSIVVAKAGRGGHGNSWYKSATNQSPRHAEDGRLGEQVKLALELKLLADVGLVGLPNAGKSTMLAALSSARPKIADYPFTTLTPNLGIVKLREYKSFVMADIPGLIEGAAQGKGLGHQFLKHIQRTRLVVYVIDINEPDIPTTRAVLENELKSFDSSLAAQPSLTIITKIDSLPECDVEAISQRLPSDYIYLSALAHKGVDLFLQEVERKLDQCPA